MFQLVGAKKGIVQEKPKLLSFSHFGATFYCCSAKNSIREKEINTSSRLGSDDTNEIIRHDDISPFEVSEGKSSGNSCR